MLSNIIFRVETCKKKKHVNLLFSGINNVRQMEIFRVLSGILHMGNVVFKQKEEDSEASFVPVSFINISNHD